MASTSTVQCPIPGPIKHNDSIYIFYKPANVPKAEILFFHDVLWKECEEPHVHSWMSSGTPSVCWPEVWLMPKFPEARILSVRYDAALRKSTSGGYMDLFVVAENLRHDILDICAGNCPVVLVGHGFGGLVIKQLIFGMHMVSSNFEPSTKSPYMCKLDCFMTNVHGIFYFAPPFSGSKLIDSMKDLPDAGLLVQFLQQFDETIVRLNDWFRQWRKDRCETRAISAALPTEVHVESKVPFLSKCKYAQVVEEASARNDVDFFYTTSKDHFGVCKPEDQTDSGYKMLCGLIEQVMLPIVGSAKQMNDIIENDSDERVNNILSILSQVESFHLPIAELQKITKFPKSAGRLQNGLTEAGFERTNQSACGELWEKI
ncbi:unnamed protein product [Calypogeia fissa]